MTNEEFLKSITLEGEMWKDVAGYEGCYMVSNFGRVMSLGREVPNSDKSNRIIRPSIMSLNIKNAKRKSSIYQTYTAHLCKNRIRKAITVHRLVACAFIENPNNYPSIDHIDGNVVESFEYSFHLPVVQLVLFLDSYEHGIIHVVRRLFLPLLLRLYQ